MKEAMRVELQAMVQVAVAEGWTTIAVPTRSVAGLLDRIEALEKGLKALADEAEVQAINRMPTPSQLMKEVEAARSLLGEAE